MLFRFPMKELGENPKLIGSKSDLGMSQFATPIPMIKTTASRMKGWKLCMTSGEGGDHNEIGSVPSSYVCWFINHSKYRYSYHKPS